jgi:hypothetical protein
MEPELFEYNAESGELSKQINSTPDFQSFDSTALPETIEKKKRGRKPGTTVKKAIEKYKTIDENTCKLFAGILPFTILSIVLKNKDYELNSDEKSMLAPLWGDVCDKYLPAFLSQYAPEFSLFIAISFKLIEKSKILEIINKQEA